MAVESRFVVIRHGAEIQTFMDKKSADEYDKMLDMADSLTEMLQSAPIELSDSLKEELGIYLAKNREQLLVALQVKKPPVIKKEVAKKETIKKEAVKSAAAKIDAEA